MESPGRPDNGPEVASVHLADGNAAPFAEEAAGPLEVFIAAGDPMTLARKELTSSEPVAPAPRTKMRIGPLI